jgi:hypothetical protein
LAERSTGHDWLSMWMGRLCNSKVVWRAKSKSCLRQKFNKKMRLTCGNRAKKVCSNVCYTEPNNYLKTIKWLNYGVIKLTLRPAAVLRVSRKVTPVATHGHTPSVLVKDVILDNVWVKHWEYKSSITFKLLSLQM